MTDKTGGSRLTLTVERFGDVFVVKCSGRLVAGVSDRLYLEVKELIPGQRRIVLDFADLTHMDSTGLGSLIRLYVSAKSAGCALELDHIGKPIRHLLGMTHLLSVLGSVCENNIRVG